MKKVLCVIGLAAGLLILPTSSLAQPLTLSADIDPGECDISIGALSFNLEDAVNAKVVSNSKWIIAHCNVRLGKGVAQQLGVTEAVHFWDFECLVENERTAEDVPAFASHAVFTPAGNLNIVCIAENVVNGG